MSNQHLIFLGTVIFAVAAQGDLERTFLNIILCKKRKFFLTETNINNTSQRSR